MFSIKSKLALAILSTALIVGCGSSSKGTNDTSLDNTPPESNQVPIEGLKYQRSDATIGYTDAQGNIAAADNQTVQFYLGDLAIGDPVEATNNALDTLLSAYFPQTQADMNNALYYMYTYGSGVGFKRHFDSYSASAENGSFEATRKLYVLANMAQLILSFDNDKEFSNGILIEQNVHELSVDQSIEFDRDFNSIYLPRGLDFFWSLDTAVLRPANYFNQGIFRTLPDHPKNHLLWLKAAVDAGNTSSLATPTAPLSLSWVHSHISDLPQPMAVSQEQTLDESSSVTKTNSVSVDAENLSTVYSIDEGATGHANSQVNQTMNSLGQYMSDIGQSRTEGVSEWTTTSSDVYERDSQGFITKYSTGADSEVVYDFTLNELGQITKAVKTESNVQVYEMNLSYWTNNYDVKAYSIDFATASGAYYDAAQRYNENGLQLVKVVDTDDDGISEEAYSFLYEDAYNPNKITSIISYGPLAFTIDATTFELAITTALLDRVEMLRSTITYDESNGVLLTQTNTATVDCAWPYECSDSSYEYSYTDELIDQKLQHFGADTNTTNITYHASTDVINSIEEITNQELERRIYHYNEDGQKTSDEVDDPNDGAIDSRTTKSYTAFGRFESVKGWSTDPDNVNTPFNWLQMTYNDSNQLERRQKDNDKSGIFEEEWLITYEQGLVSEFFKNDIDEGSGERTQTDHTVYSYQTGDFIQLCLNGRGRNKSYCDFSLDYE